MFKYKESTLLNFRSSDSHTVNLENGYRMHIQEVIKCVGNLCKSRKIHKSTLIGVYYSFAFPYALKEYPKYKKDLEL